MIFRNRSDVTLEIINKKTEIKAIIFDFDFTLADSSKGVFECVNYALQELGFRRFPKNEINKTIGLTLDHTLVKLVGKQHSDKTEKFKHFFIKKADEVMADLTVLFTETPRVVQVLYNKGIKLGIVSTKFRYRIAAILSRENLLNCFEVIVGGEDISALKPDPSGLLLAIKKLKISPSEVVYIGDSLTDAETANRAGISFIAILSGVTPQIAFARYKVRDFLKNISELPKILNDQ
ncbi:MAG: HAD family hydrolase [Candidatus Thorarchaeota archaeon]